MHDKLLIIISTGEPGKARAGAMYAVNALKHAWMEEVQLYFFGPAEELLTRDKPLQDLLLEYQNEDQTALACKVVTDTEGIGEQVAALDVDIQYLGEKISKLIKEGYTPIVW